MVFTMPRSSALSLGLLICLCKHRENNHFDFDKNPCAHCECKEYTETCITGRIGR